MNLPDPTADALPEGDLRHPRSVSTSAPPLVSSRRPDNATMTMLVSGMTPREIRAESRGGIGGGYYGHDDESDLGYFRGRGQRS